MASPYQCGTCGQQVDPKGTEHQCPGTANDRLVALERKLERLDRAMQSARSTLRGELEGGRMSAERLGQLLTGLLGCMNDDEPPDSSPQSMR